MLAFVAIARRVSPGRFTEYAWGQLVQWGTYLVKTRDVHLAMRKAAAGAGADFFSNSSALNGPVPGSSCAGACMQYSTGDPALPGTAMSGAIWARCLVPPELGDSAAAEELIMATIASKEVMAYLMQTRELGHEPRAPTALYLDATAVLHGTTKDQVSREMKYLAAMLAIVQQARAHGKIRTIKTKESIRPSGIVTKPLQGESVSTSERGSMGSKGGCRRRRRASRRTRRAWMAEPRSRRRLALVSPPAIGRRRRPPERTPPRGMSSWRSVPPPVEGARRPAGPTGMSEAHGATSCHRRA